MTTAQAIISAGDKIALAIFLGSLWLIFFSKK